MKRFNRLVTILLSLILIISTMAANTFAEDTIDDDWIIRCTEKEAYEEGFDFYRTWYIVNKGYWAQFVFGYYPPYHSIVTQNRNDPGYSFKVAEWRTMTLNLDELFNNTEKKTAYCEALLFNLLYDEENAELGARITNDMTGMVGEFNKLEKNLNHSMWKKIWKAMSFSERIEIDTHLDSLTAADIEELVTQSKWVTDTWGKAADITDFIDYVNTAGEYIDGLAKLHQIMGMSNDISRILASMRDYTDDVCYSAALNHFSHYVSESVNEQDAVALFTGTTAVKVGAEELTKCVWDALKSSFVGFTGVDLGATIGKVSANALTGIDDEFNKFNELEVYYDIERLLHSELDNILVEIEGGNKSAASRFITAYCLLNKMYNISMDCYEEYINIKYQQGTLNELFGFIQNDKYNEYVRIAEDMRYSYDQLFAADMYRADEAYKAAARKYDGDESAETVVVNDTVPEDIEECVNYYNKYKYSLGLDIRDHFVLENDLETFGCLAIHGGSLDLNGHTLTVHGDAIIEGNVSVNGVLDIRGNIYHRSGNVSITADGSFSTEKNYMQEGGGLNVNEGKLKISGDHTIGYIDSEGEYTCNAASFQILNSGTCETGGNLLVYKSTGIELTSGSIKVGGDLRALTGWISSNPEFQITMTGSEAIRIENLYESHSSANYYYGGNLTVENAEGRSVTMAGTVKLSKLTGEGLVITPDELRFGAIPQNDIVIDGDVTVPYRLDMNGNDVVINGNITIQSPGSAFVFEGYSGLAIDGHMAINGNLDQTGGDVVISGGQLDVSGNHTIGYIDSEGNYKDELAVFSITDNGVENLQGDLLAYSINSSSLISGTLRVGDNLCSLDDIINVSPDFEIVMEGTKSIRVENVGRSVASASYYPGGNLTIENANGRNVTFAGDIKLSKLTGEGLVITPDELRFGAVLQNDVVIDGDVIVPYVVHLNGNKVTVNGTVQHFENGDIYMDGGIFEIAGDYTADNYASLDMSNENDRFTVGGDVVIKSMKNFTLTAGIMSIAGDFTQSGEGAIFNFAPGENHKVVLNGTKKQIVTFGTAPHSKFNILELRQDRNMYEFNPDPCWNTLIEFCEHSDTEIRDKIDATCTTDGYSGDLYCKICGTLLEEGEAIQSEGHKLTYVEAVEATYEAPGNIEHWECSECHKCFSDESGENEITEPVVIPAKDLAEELDKVRDEIDIADAEAKAAEEKSTTSTNDADVAQAESAAESAVKSAEEAESLAEKVQKAAQLAYDNASEEDKQAALDNLNAANINLATAKSLRAAANSALAAAKTAAATIAANSAVASQKQAESAVNSAQAFEYQNKAAEASSKASVKAGEAEAASAEAQKAAEEINQIDVNEATETAINEAKSNADKAANSAREKAGEAGKASAVAKDSAGKAKSAADKKKNSEAAAEELNSTKAGMEFTVNGFKYKIMANVSGSNPGTVAVMKAKNVKKVTVPAVVKYRNKTFNVTQINAKAFTAKKIRTVTIGKNIKTIKKNAFAKSKATKLIIRTKLLTKKSVKGCLKSSKVKTVQVKVGSKKVNKTYVKKYKKIFTKKNAGKKVTVK